MAFCTNCGVKLEDHHKFCFACGTAVTAAEEVKWAYESMKEYPHTYCGRPVSTNMGTLTISGNGAMESYYDHPDQRPWAEYLNQCECVVVDAGITDTGAAAFRDFSVLEYAEVSEGVSTIGAETFRHCPNLRAVSLPASLKTVMHNAFGDCPELKRIYFGGSEEQWKKITVHFDNQALENAAVDFGYPMGIETMLSDE